MLKQVVNDREAWLKEAEAAEQSGATITCGAIVRATVHLGVESEDRKRTWLDDAENCLNRGSITTARAILAHALGAYPTKKGVWMRYYTILLLLLLVLLLVVVRYYTTASAIASSIVIITVSIVRY
jgi:hypothetical protein